MRGQTLRFFARVSPGRDAPHVLRHVSDVLVALASQVAGGGRAHAKVGFVSPIGQIVPALLARPGEIADLVLSEARARQPVDGGLVHVRLQVRVDWRDPTRLRLCVQARARFVGQPVAGNVLRLECNRLVETEQPGLQALPRYAEDQVQADGPHAGRAADRDRLRDLLGPVRSLENAQFCRLKRLRPHRHAVHAGGNEHCGLLGVDCGRVGLDREL